MAFKGPIGGPGGASSDSQKISDAFASGMSVSGLNDTKGNLRAYDAMSLFLSTFTSKRMAQTVLQSSNRHVPYDTSALHDSGKVTAADGSVVDKPTAIDENIEANVVMYARGLDRIAQSFSTTVGFFGTERVFQKYVVGYYTDYAVVVHENVGDRIKFHQDSHARRKWPDEKTDHFLLDAYNKYKHKYSSAMLLGMKEIERAVGNVAEKQARALSSGTGAPRLVKR